METRAVILDMDGLLLDTERVSLRAFAAASGALGLEMTLERYARIVGLRREEIPNALHAAFPGVSFDAEALWRDADAHYARLISDEPVPTRPHARAFLEFLEKRGVPRAVATSTRTERARYKLERAGLLDLLPIVVGGEAVARGKPHPDIYLEAARRLGARAEGVLVFEDSPRGVRGAAAAGMRAVMVPDLAPPSEGDLALTAAVFPDLGAARRALEEGRI